MIINMIAIERGIWRLTLPANINRIFKKNDSFKNYLYKGRNQITNHVHIFHHIFMDI